MRFLFIEHNLHACMCGVLIIPDTHLKSDVLISVYNIMQAITKGFFADFTDPVKEVAEAIVNAR